MAATDGDLGPALARTLTDLLSVELIAKQAHWNIVGEGFGSLHSLFDQLAAAARQSSDDVAERSITLGCRPDGQPDAVARGNPFPSLPLGPLTAAETLPAFVEISDILTTRLFDTISASTDDPVTEELLVAAAARLEKVAWALRAHAVR